MFYPNYFKIKNVKYKKFNYASFANGLNTDYDERLLPIRYSKNTYNFSYSNGSLKNGLGISELRLAYDPTNRSLTHSLNFPQGVDILGAWVFNRYSINLEKYVDLIVVYCSDGFIYMGYMYNSSTLLVKVNGVSFSSIPNVINYNLNGVDVLLMGTKEDGLYVYDTRYTPYKINDSPNISSMCIHYERLFVTIDGDKRSLYFSDDLDPTNWNLTLNEGGFINMVDDKGTLNRVVSFKDYLYVFREFGIARVSAYASQEDFHVTQLYTSNGRIYPKSICVCGDSILFLASDGIYSFNGVTANKISLKIDNMLNEIANDNAVGAFHNGSYYLACKLNFNDGEQEGCESGSYVNNALIEINLSSASVNFMRGVDIVNLQVLNNIYENKLIVSFKYGERYMLGQVDKSGSVFGVALKKVWKSPLNNFGESAREKIITEFDLFTNSNIKVVINHDGKSNEFLIKGGDGIKRIKPNIRGYEFGIDFICENANCCISLPQITVGYI